MIVTGLTAAVAFLQFGSIQMTILVAAVSLVITTLEGFLLTPWLTSRAARMNAVAVFVGLLFWGWVWNVWGMLLAVPMLMVIKAVCDHVEDFAGGRTRRISERQLRVAQPFQAAAAAVGRPEGLRYETPRRASFSPDGKRGDASSRSNSCQRRAPSALRDSTNCHEILPRL